MHKLRAVQGMTMVLQTAQNHSQSLMSQVNMLAYSVPGLAHSRVQAPCLFLHHRRHS